MRRAALAIVSTIAGLVLLLGFKTHGSAAIGGGTVALAPATGGTTTSGSAGSGSAGTGGAGQGSAGTRATGASSSPATHSASRSTTRTVAGRTYDTQYGPVQVQVTESGGRITDVAALQLPQGSGRDIDIDNYAVPQLRAEALQAQSAHIDAVSGATYTSAGYIDSLQSALDQLKS